MFARRRSSRRIPAVPVVHPILVFLVVLQALVDPLPLVAPVSLQALVDPVVPEVLVVPEEEGKSHIPLAEVLCSNHTDFVCY
ncbi:hypothetical protein [Rossellomorea marisflavi]|uniref:hypothetical protein n=1 Tax=Rossellomorea marisflavi TaxID=189381 RepID=UPI0035672A1A